MNLRKSHPAVCVVKAEKGEIGNGFVEGNVDSKFGGVSKLMERCDEDEDFVLQVQEVVKTGRWVGDCFIYTSSVNRLNYYVGGEIVTIAHLDRSVCTLTRPTVS